jgi:hypothetical protein
MWKYIPPFCIIFAIVSAAFIVVSWGIGYYNNAWHGTKFELSSCKDMLIAAGSGLVGVLLFAINSVYNSPKGEHPK